jgi:hypothetical protein
LNDFVERVVATGNRLGRGVFTGQGLEEKINLLVGVQIRKRFLLQILLVALVHDLSSELIPWRLDLNISRMQDLP